MKDADTFKSIGFIDWATETMQKRIDILRNFIAPKVLNCYPQFAKKLWFN